MDGCQARSYTGVLKERILIHDKVRKGEWPGSEFAGNALESNLNGTVYSVARQYLLFARTSSVAENKQAEANKRDALFFTFCAERQIKSYVALDPWQSDESLLER